MATKKIGFALSGGGALINSKGFGGNNASGLFLSPGFTNAMLAKRWGKASFAAYQKRKEPVVAARMAYDAAMRQGTLAPIYRFGQGVLGWEDISLSKTEMPFGIRPWWCRLPPR